MAMTPSLKAALAFAAVAVLALLAPEISSPGESGKAGGTASGELPPAPPLGLSGLPIPNDNPITRAKVDLGQMLFFEKRLSGDGTVACASCHMPGRGFSNGRKYGIGVGGRLGLRHVPALVNAAYSKFLFWDGRAESLEEQAKSPMLNPAEMAATEGHIVRTLSAIAGYRSAFGEAFGTEEITLERVAKAIATFERTILSGRSPFDRWKYGGEESAISEEAKRGFEIFRGKANCAKCHLINESSAPFTDNKFHNAGIGFDEKTPPLGREKFTKNPIDRGRFKTPTLREIAKSAPYMHDGRFNTIEEVIDYFSKGGISNPNLDTDIKRLHLIPEEKKALAAFLRTLTGNLPKVKEPKLPK